MADLPPGALDLLVLQTLKSGSLHGYALARRIRDASEDVLQVEEGTLYPALHRMERRGWLSSAWDKSETGRRAKFYSVTRKGRAALKKERSTWERTTGAIARVLNVEPA